MGWCDCRSWRNAVGWRRELKAVGKSTRAELHRRGHGKVSASTIAREVKDDPGKWGQGLAVSGNGEKQRRDGTKAKLRFRGGDFGRGRRTGRTWEKTVMGWAKARETAHEA